MVKLNIGIVAHVDAGKTTLTENILYLGGVISEVGRVDLGSTQTDSMEIERRRGISVRAAATSFELNNVKFNLIDTPGHVDFVAEVERSLQVLDGVILVISAKEGIQSGTQILMDTIMSQKIPAAIFINKIDRMGADPAKVANEANDIMGGRFIFTGEVLEGGVIKHFDKQELMAQNEETLYSVCEHLMELFINNEEISHEVFFQNLTKQSRQGILYPVFFGSALRGIGVRELLDALPFYLPNAEENMDAALSGVVFKIDSSGREKQCYVRLYQGSLSIRTSINIQGKEEKITRLSGLSNGKIVNMPCVTAGDIAILYFKDLNALDIIGEPSARQRNFSLGKPTLMTEAVPVNQEQKRALYEALVQLADEDPMLNLSMESGGLMVQMFGEVQMEILSELLAERFSCPVTFLEAITIHAETPSKPAQVIAPIYRNGTPFPAGVGFLVEPLPRGSGVKYVSKVSYGELEKSFQNAVEAAVCNTCKNGIYGWEITDCQVSFIYSDYDSVNGTPSAYRDLTPLALMEAFVNAEMELLEPIMKFELKVPETSASKALYDCERMRAMDLHIESLPGFIQILGLVPAATCKKYAVQVSSYTEGRGIFTAKFHGYQPTPVCQSKINEKGINPAVNKGLYLLQKLGAR